MRTESSAPRNGVVVAAGYGLKIYVERGHLVVHDGIGATRSTRRFNRVTSKLKRLVVLGHTGYISLEATRWLQDIGAGWIQLAADGTVVSLSTGPGIDLPALRRAQALAPCTDTGLAIARLLLTEKTDGQAGLLPELSAAEHLHRTMRNCCHAIATAQTIDELVAAEASAASAYWDAWAPVEVRFGPRDGTRLPSHWRTFGQRHSPLSRSPRLAINPANAILNYLYALLEAETTFACAAVGLDPGLGVFHSDKRARASLSLDVMEACRPLVDAYLLTLLRQRTLSLGDLVETRRGGCRVLAPLAKHLATTSTTWHRYVAPVAERVARIIGESGPAHVDVPTTLTGANRRAAWGGRTSRQARAAPVAPLPPTCRNCGGELPGRGRRYCEQCRRASAERAGQTGRAAAQAALARLRNEGRDPGHGGEAARRRGQKNAEHQRRIAEWLPEPGVAYTPEEFRRHVLPSLRERSIAELVAATGLSDHYCSLIRLGKRVPHPRHWAALEALAL